MSTRRPNAAWRRGPAASWRWTDPLYVTLPQKGKRVAANMPHHGSLTPMARLVFTEEADHSLAALLADGSRRLLYDRVNDALDRLEDDPHDARGRRRRYADPPLWGVLVNAADDRWLILWDLADDVVTVFFIGPDLA